MIVFLSITPEERTFCPDGGANRSGLQPKATETCLWLSADGGEKKKKKIYAFILVTPGGWSPVLKCVWPILLSWMT